MADSKRDGCLPLQTDVAERQSQLFSVCVAAGKADKIQQANKKIRHGKAGLGEKCAGQSGGRDLALKKSNKINDL
jgi:hypothetical protein